MQKTMDATINKHPIITSKSVLKGAKRYFPLPPIVLKTKIINPIPSEITKAE
jgi:hypothetical protein